MATVAQGVCASFLLELHQGIHDFTSDTLKVALYDDADLSPDTTAYSSDGEIVGTGYTAGGEDLVFADGTPALDGRTLRIQFVEVVWIGGLIARAALIYNSSKSNRAVAVIDFGGLVGSVSGSFTLPWPSPLGELRAFQVA